MKKILLILLLINFSFTTYLNAQRQMEKLNRGLVAIPSNGGYFLSWRLLATDPSDIAFNVYKGSTKLNSTPVTVSTTFSDNTSGSGIYTVKPVIGDVEQAASENAIVVSGNYLKVALKKPADGTAPDNTTYSYTPNDCSVGDVDGDGEYEIIVKWDPTNSKDNSQDGYTGNVYLDAYKLNGTQVWRINLGKNIRAGAHYTQFMVYDLDGDGKAEVACKTAPGTVDGKGNYLSKGPAASDDDAADYRTGGSWAGFITSGPEYLTIFSGLTGEELTTVNYEPNRNPNTGWGKSSENYNRVDRFLACIAYLDGVKPSLVMCRGYYGRLTIAAWDWRGGQLTKRWLFDSNNTGYSAYAGQGNHNLSVADVDNDGKDEIIYGSSAYDDNGTPIYTTGMGHGDAMHVSDLLPDSAGLEVWSVKESGGFGSEVHNARTGKIYFQFPDAGDVGRGLAADLYPDYKGFEMWSARTSGIINAKGYKITTNAPSMNFRIYWDGDLQDELLDGTNIQKWSSTTNSASTILSASTYGAASNNSTKSTPCLSADIFGDWREEVIFRNGTTNDELQIYSTTYPTNYRIYSLMQDPVYRLGIAWQNVAYNQPPHLGFYIGDGLSKLYPTVKITSPSSGTLNNVTSIQLKATAEASGCIVSKVEYYKGTEKLGESTNAPFTFNWTGVADGDYKITAVATASNGAVGKSPEVNVTVKTNTAVINTTSSGSFNVFPNPYHDKVTIEASGRFDYTIFNTAGVAVEKGKGVNQVFAGLKLQPGLYLLHITTEKDSKVVKISKK